MIGRLGRLFPQSAYAKMSPEQMTVTAREWARQLWQVPAPSIEPLFDQVLRVREGKFPPDYQEFEIAWGHIARAQYENAQIEKRQAESEKKARGAATVLPAFSEHHKRYGLVTCHCKKDVSEHAKSVWAAYGVKFPNPKPVAALLVTVQDLAALGWEKRFTGLVDGHRYWVCADGKCNFILHSELLPQENANAATVAKSMPEKPGLSQSTLYSEIVKCWNIDLDRMTPEQSAELGAFANWWSKNFEGTPTRDDYTARRNEFVAWRRENRRKMMQSAA